MSDAMTSDNIITADNEKYMIRCENLVKIYKTDEIEVVAVSYTHLTLPTILLV